MSTSHFSFTQATSGVGSQKQKSSYQPWCEKFIAQAASATTNARGSSHIASANAAGQAVTEVRKAFEFLTENKRYERLFRFMTERSSADHGGLFARMLTAFFATLHLIEEPMKHRKILLEHSVNLLTSAPLSSQSHSTITALINAQLTECSVLDLETLRDMLQGQLLDGANDGNRKRLGVLLAVLEVIGVRDPQRDDEDKSSTQSVTLSALYERSTSASCKTIAKLIREVNETTVLKKFISRTLRADETHELGKPLTWSRVAAALDVLDQDEFVAVLSGFTKHWDSHARDQLVNHVTGFTLLQSFFSSRPSYASAVIKFFKKHPHHIWDNMFSLVHLCVLCSVDRHATEVAGIMACAFGKFWSEGDLIRRGPWAQSMIRGNSTTNMRDNVTALLELMKASEAWFNLLGPALMRISMDIMLTCTTTKQGFGFTNGQQQTAGEVGSIAQSTFVEVALHNGRDLDHQLGRLIDAVFAFASNSSVAFLLVDVILEISRRGVAMLMNATEAFKKLVDDIWILPGDASVVLIRLLHPVISLRPELQHTLLEKLKSQLVRPSMVSTAVPILLLLWKTLIHLPSMANNPRLQARQSFATFSSQTPTNAGVVRRREELMTLEITGLVKRVFGQSPAAKHHVCGAMVEMGSKIPFFAIQALDFLLSHMKSLPPLAIDEYLERSENDVIAKHPVARLVKTVSALLRITMQQDDENTAVRELARSANETVENLLYEVASKSLEDLSLGGLAEHRASKHDQGTIVFGRTMVQLYDALIQHTWLMSGGEITYEESEILHKLLVLREELDRIPTETSRRKGPAKGPQGQISTAVFWMIDDCLDTDLPDLDLTLQALLGYTFSDANRFLEPLMKGQLLPWTLNRIMKHFTCSKPTASPCTRLQNCHKSLAKVLLTMLLDDKHDVEALNDAVRGQSVKNMALDCFAYIMQYHITHHSEAAASTLRELLSCFTDVDFDQNPLTRSRLRENEHADVDEPEGWTDLLMHHLYALSCTLLNLLRPESAAIRHEMKGDAMLQRRVLKLVELCAFILQTLTRAPRSAKRTLYEIFSKCTEKCTIDDKRTVEAIFELMFDLLAESDCGEWTASMFHDILEQLKLTSTDPEDISSGWRSISVKNRDTIFAQLLRSLKRIFTNAHPVIAYRMETSQMIDDEFLVPICETMRHFADLTVRATDLSVQQNCELQQLAIMLPHFYDALTVIFKQLEYAVKNQHVNGIEDWWCLEVLDGILRDSVAPIHRKCLDSMMGTWDTRSMGLGAQHKVRRVKRDERTFVCLEKSSERLFVTASMVGRSIGREAFTMEVQPAFRCFQLETENVIKRLERRSSDATGPTFSTEEEQAEETGSPQPKRKRV